MANYKASVEGAEHSSLRVKVFNQLREDILLGKYAEKEELKESAICKRLQVSRTPVREALRQLELEGLVSIIPNKGAYVNGITAKDIYDIYTIRSYLEGLCAKWACEHITPEVLEQLEEVIYLSEFHMQKGHQEQMFDLDNRFHRLIYEASGSNILEHVLADFHHYVERIRMVTLAENNRAENANEEHKLILESLKNRDSERAEKLATQHILNTMENISHQGLENLLAKNRQEQLSKKE